MTLPIYAYYTGQLLVTVDVVASGGKEGVQGVIGVSYLRHCNPL